MSLLPVCNLSAVGSSVQSALHPAGPAAARIAGLWWLMFGVLAAVFLVVLGMLALALTRGRPLPASRAVRLVAIAGMLVPTVILVGLMIQTVRTTVALDEPATGPRIQVVGHRWWWEVRYPGQGIVGANELQIPAGIPVRLEVWTDDVIHSLWVPELNGKIDLLPGKVNTFWLQADRPGVFRGQCAEFCGLQHAHMALWVEAMPEGDYARWLARHRMPPAPPAGALERRGQAAFLRAGCVACHTVRGTVAHGRLGPDLTMVGSRRSLAAGTLPNTRGNLEGWIADSQALKPGNLMPRQYVSPEDLHALAAYLESLK